MKGLLYIAIFLFALFASPTMVAQEQVEEKIVVVVTDDGVLFNGEATTLEDVPEQFWQALKRNPKIKYSISAKSNNVVIYATSNRRHLVKENFSDREGDDVHFNDTMQELLSLSERFGIQLTFNRPDKAVYLDLKLFKKIGNNDPTAITEVPGGKIKVSVVVPDLEILITPNFLSFKYSVSSYK